MTIAHPSTTAPLIEGIEQVDAAWLEAALSTNHPGTTIEAITVEPVGAGNVSDTVRVSITYGDRPPGAPGSVVVKLRPSAPEVHAHGLASGAYHREIGAYRTITERAACRIPGLFHVAGDETNINLVIEDLTVATPGDQVAGCGITQARAVLTQLARLHATYLPMDPATAPAWPIRLADVADYWAEKMQVGARAAAERYTSQLGTDELDTIAAATAVARDWHLLPQQLLTLTHGDPRVDNVLFESTAGGEAVLIDWQVTGIRNPMYDVGYFLSGSVDADVRRPAEDALLEHYVAVCNQVRPGTYSIPQARADLATQMLSGLVITTAAIAVLPDNDVVNRLIVALLRRNVAAAQDWDSVALTTARR
jgi:hypothetical protein